MNRKNKEALLKLAFMKMPFGKFKNRYLSDLPEAYLVWFHRQGFPKGTLGQHMQMVYDLKVNGEEGILVELRKKYPDPFKKNQ